ncbi:MAG TPA: PilZ domain-containing protein [Candidatus Dormibacteraeota bacterium]|nr:PilZ domain-containing protein [Candidatus Dormibacteraeota bacterium]
MALRALTKTPQPTLVDARLNHEGAPRTGGRLLSAVDAFPRTEAVTQRHAETTVVRFLRAFHVLLRSARLYSKNHPRVMENLDAAERSLRAAMETVGALAISVERGGIVVPKLSEMPIADSRYELSMLGAELNEAGISTLVFYAETNLGELETLAQLTNGTLIRSEAHGRIGAVSSGGQRETDWASRLAEHHIAGITVNTHIERRVDSVLASLIAAMMAYGGASREEAAQAASTPVSAPKLEELAPALRLLARLTPPLEIAGGTSAQDAARAIHSTLAEAERKTVRLLVATVNDKPPREGELPQPYLIRLSESLIFQFVQEEFVAGRLNPYNVRPLFDRLGDDLVAAGGYTGPHSSQHLTTLAAHWANEAYREGLVKRFWTELAPREKSSVLRSSNVWCVPVAALRQALEQLGDAGADASRREARLVLLNYARCLENESVHARRAAAAGLCDLQGLTERFWPHQLPEELSRGVLRALSNETIPEIAALLAALTENLARLAVERSDFPAFETILVALEQAPRDDEHAHLAALATRLVADDRWLLLVDAALANRALDPVLPRLLHRDPERLLDRLSLLLTETQGPEVLPAMARLLRVMGVPVLGLLETRLFEARRQRASAAVKMLAAADSARLVRCLPRALPSWDWSLQDLAISELARPANQASSTQAAFAFLAVLPDANPLVVPMMIDQIGLAQELSAVPQLMEIAAGKHESLRDLFIRIKSIEALARLRAEEAAPVLRAIIQERSGLVYVEPAGLRAAAEEALQVIENNPSSVRLRAAYEAVERSSLSYTVPRRYARIPLSSPLNAQIQGSQPATVRVRTISLGGAYLESDRRLAVGDSIKLEIRSGLRKIHSTAVVRNTGPAGGGIEFVHMKEDDREKLRRLVRRHLS